MRVRLREVAAHAGVSEATVSRVLNARPNVSSRTRAVVLEAVEALGGARPDDRAPARPVNERLVAIVMPELDNPIFAVMAHLLSVRLAVSGRTSLVARCGTATEETATLEQLAAAGITGMVMVSGAHADASSDMTTYGRLRERGVAMVFVNGYRPEVAPAPFVSCDDRHAAILAVRHLVSLGHRRIGFISGPHRYTVVQRKLGGYRAALKAAGIARDDSLVVETMFSAEAGHDAASGLIDAGTTAVVTASDILALGAIRGARDRGLEVPRDWSVIGYDDTALMAYTDPPLTTVRQPVRAMCHAAADMIDDRLSGRPPRVGELVFRPELVVRGSTAPAP